jgi:hypothetical protein
MGFFSKLAQSADLVRGMADRVNADFVAKDGDSSEFQGARYRSLVIRCSTCTDQAACADLQASSAHLDAAPGYCRNKAELDAARAG